MAKHILVILFSSYLVFNLGNTFAAPNDDVEDPKEFHEVKSDKDGNGSFITSRENLGFEKTLVFFINEMEKNIKKFIDTSLTQIDEMLSRIQNFASEQFNKGVSGNLCLLARKKRSSLLPIVGKVTQFITTNFVKNILRTRRSLGNIQQSKDVASFEDRKSEGPYGLQSIAEFARERQIFEADINAGSRRVKQQKGTRTNPAHRTPTTPTSVTFPVSSTAQETPENVIETSETVTSIVNKLTDAIDVIRSVLEIFTTGRKRREIRKSFATLRSSFEDLSNKFVHRIEEIFNNCVKLVTSQISERIRKRRSLNTLGYPNVPTRTRFSTQTVDNSLKNVAAARQMVSNRRDLKPTTTMRNPQESNGSNLTLLLQLPGNIVRGALNISSNAIKSAFKLISPAGEELEEVQKRSGFRKHQQESYF